MVNPTTHTASKAGPRSWLHLGLRMAVLVAALGLLLVGDEWIGRTLYEALILGERPAPPQGFSLKISWVDGRPIADIMAEAVSATLALWGRAAAVAVIPALVLAWAARKAPRPWLQELLEAPFVAAAFLPVPALGLVVLLAFLAEGPSVAALGRRAVLVMAVLFFGVLARAVHGAYRDQAAQGVEWVEGRPPGHLVPRLALARTLANLAWFLPLVLVMTAVVESMAAIPGVGQRLVVATMARNYPLWWAAARTLLVTLLALRLLMDLAAWLVAGGTGRGGGEAEDSEPVQPVAATAAPDAGSSERGGRRPVPWLLLVLAAVLLAYGLGPVFSGPAAPGAGVAVDLTRRNLAPGEVAGHPWGTDAFGRDVYSFYAAGGRVTGKAILVALAAALVAGGVLGLVVGVLRRHPVGWVLDALWGPWVYGLGAAGPFLVPLLWRGLSGGLDLLRLIQQLALGAVPAVILLVAQAVAAGERRRAYGPDTPARGERRPFLSTLGGTVLLAAQLLAAEAALGYLGLSVVPPTPSWGAMLGSMAGPLLRGDGPQGSGIVPLHMLAAVVGVALLGQALRRWGSPVGE